MQSRNFSFLFFIVVLLVVEFSKSEKLVRQSSQFLGFFLKNASIDSSQLQDRDNLIEGISSFLSSVHSKRKKNDENDNLLLRSVQQYANSTSDDSQCLQDITTWQKDTTKLYLYALQMKDSWSSRQGGMLEGNVRWPGHYYECVNAVGQNFRGKYCTTYYGFKYLPIVQGVPYDITFDTCFPDSCSEHVIHNLTAAATTTDIRVPALETHCSYEDKSFTGFEISIIVISSIFLLLACIGTIHDIILRSRNADPQNNESWTLCFSVLKNGEKILSTKQSPNNIAAINGIRLISTLWVILGHTIAMVILSVDNTITMGKEVRRRFEFMVIFNGTFSVDTFFLIAGLLTSYLTLKQLKKTKGKLNVPMMYLHRYLRLTPLYAYVLIFSIGLFKFMGDGPHWQENYIYTTQNCKDDWWTNLLYINNLYPVSNHCFTHSWYLASDMQFYILSPFFIYFLYKWPRTGVFLTSLFTLASIGTTWGLSQDSNQQPMVVLNAIMYSILSRIIYIQDPPEMTYQSRFKTDLYLTPWCRISVYLVGILAGYILHKTQRKLKLSKIVVFIGWFVAVGTGISIVYGLYGASSELHTIDLTVAAFYNAVSRPLWGACVAWVIIACSCGYGGPVTKFLNWSLFLPLSRLTYAVYLIHLYVVYWNVFTLEVYVHYSAVWLVYSFAGNVIISFCLAFLAALLIEWPCQEILKLLLSSGRSSKSSHTETRAETVSIGKPPSYRSEDNNCVLDETNKVPLEDQKRFSGEKNSTFEMNETTRI